MYGEMSMTYWLEKLEKDIQEALGDQWSGTARAVPDHWSPSASCMSFSSFSSQYVMLISPYIAGRDRQVLLGLLAFTRPPVEPAEADVAVGRERAHLELGGQGHG